MPISVWAKAIGATARVLAAVLRLLRKVPVIDDAVQRITYVLLNPVVVRVIRNPTDPDLDLALTLYQRRIPEDQRFEPSDIVRWLTDDLASRQQPAPQTTDWFLVAKYRRRVSGFLLLHYYARHRLLFGAYMVVEKAPGPPPNTVSAALSHALSRLLKRRKELSDCVGLVIEVEDPRHEPNAKQRADALARIRRFCMLAAFQGWTLRALDIEYLQPRLSLMDEDGSERPLLLMFARTQRHSGHAAISPEEVAQVLSFIYTDLYPEGFSSDPGQNELYRQYCAKLMQRVIAALPPIIHLLDCGELVSQARRTKSNVI